MISTPPVSNRGLMFANATVGGVNDKEAAGCPFVDIAGDDLHIRGTVGIDGVAFVDPAAEGRWIL